MASTMKVSFSTNSGIRMKAIDKAKLAVLFLVGVWAYSFKDNLTELFYSYTESGYEKHGFLAIAGFCILYLSKARTLTRTTVKSSQIGLLCLLIIALLWSIANITASERLELLSCLAILPMIFFTTFGWQAVKKMYYALVFIFCALPVGQTIGEQASEMFFTILVKALSFSSENVYWQNDIIEFNGNVFNIAVLKQALQNTMFLLTITLFLSHYVTENLFKRLAMGIIALCLPIIMLILTQFIVIHFNINNQYTQETTFTYIIIGTGFILAFIIGSLGRSKRKKVFNIYGESNSWSNSGREANGRWIKPTIVSCCILLALPFATTSLKNHVLNYQGNILLSLPNQIGNWHEIYSTSNASKNNILIKQYQRSYPIAIDLRAKFFETAITNEPEDSDNLLDIEWTLIKKRIIPNNILDSTINIEEKLYSNGNQYQLLWSFYDIHSHIFAKYNYAIVADNWYTLINSARRSSLLSLAIKFTGSDVDASRSQLRDFLSNLWPDLSKISNPPRKLN